MDSQEETHTMLHDGKEQGLAGRDQGQANKQLLRDSQACIVQATDSQEGDSQSCDSQAVDGKPV
jgi:hypothetical protein